jgi:SNF2 family DNA or RNA helicase
LTIKLVHVQSRGESKIGVIVPFAQKDVVKWSGFAYWDKVAKRWCIDATPLTARSMIEVLRGAGFAAEAGDDFVRAILEAPATVDDVEIREHPLAVLPPWPHQAMGSDMIGQLNGILLWHGMGSGKTKTVYDGVVKYQFLRTIVLSPLSVVDVWRKEYRKHVHPSIKPRFRMIGLDDGSITDRKRVLSDAIERCSFNNHMLLVAINHEAAWRNTLGDLIAETEWDLAVVDESHRIKDHQTRIGKFCTTRLAPKAKHRACLTGTPIGNGLMDAFGQFMFIEPGVYGRSFTRFRAKYAIMGGFENRQVIGFQNQGDFHQRMSMVTTIVKLADVVEIPPCRDEEVVIVQDGDARKTYVSLRDDLIAEVDSGVVTATNALAKLLRLQQITSGHIPVKNEETGEDRIVVLDDKKRRAVEEILTDLPPDEPLVVFCRFTHDIRSVHVAAANCGRDCFEVSGAGNSLNEWDAACKSGKGGVIAVQIQSGGLGIDLTTACYAVYMSLGFSLNEYEQSRARLNRPGQTRPVTLYHLIVAGSVDRAVYTALSNHQKVVDAVIEALRARSWETVDGN